MSTETKRGWTAAHIPAGTSGNWRVEKFSADNQIGQLGSLFSTGRYCPPGEYTRLMRGGKLVMSDTPDERRDCSEIIYRARGRVLVVGLGLGCVLGEVLDKDSVTHIDVVERAPDVLKLVAPHFDDERVSFIESDIFDWKPPQGVRWNAAWFDIWDDMCEDNLEEMSRLARRFGRRVDWQGFWGKGFILDHRRRTKDAFWRR